MSVFDLFRKHIRREFYIKGKKIIATYYPGTGKIEYEEHKSRHFNQTNLGAFATMNKIAEAFKDVSLDKIRYRAYGENQREAEIRDKLYERELKRRGYSLEKSRGQWVHGDPIMGDNFWLAPERLWIKTKEKNLSLEKTVGFSSIILIVGSIFFLSFNLTGNVIGSINQTSSNWIGGVLFLIGLVGAFAYFRKK